MRVIPYEAEHLAMLDAQDAQRYLSAWVGDEQAKSLEDTPSYTAVHEDRVLCCAGILPIWQGRAVAWAYMDRRAGEHFIALHRRVQQFLDQCYVQRIEAHVDREFEAGHRWARMLGFDMEAERMTAFRPDGGDCSLYARVRT